MRIRTGFSFKNAYGHLEDVAKRLSEVGIGAMPISDTLSTFAYTEWTKIAKKMNMPICYGVELGVVPRLGEKKPPTDNFTFFAIDDIREINKLISIATEHPGYPSLLYSDVMEAQGVIKIAGEKCQLDYLKPTNKNLFVGLSPSLPKGLYNLAKKRKFKFIATSDNYYPRETDKELYRIALGRFGYTQTYPMHILDDDEWRAAVWYAEESDITKALANRALVIKQCKATLKTATMIHPPREKTLREMCLDGAKRLGIDIINNHVYSNRMNYELDLIQQKNFEDYFYVIADLVNWAKQRMVVGPARGSSCGSLVCYLLNITAIDPIPYNLIFERFIDITRTDLPDIDIDFSDEHRQKVFTYAEKKYGRERVARLGTVGMFQPRSILNTVGIALRIPRWQVEKVLDGQIHRSSGDARAAQQLEDTLTTTEAGRKMLEEYPEVLKLTKLEGHPVNRSQHAAGIVITEKPVDEYVAIDRRTNSAMCDKYDAETLNLLKIDALGLTQLSIFERCLELIGQKPISGWLEKLPTDDPAAFEVLNKAQYAGIFQFMGASLKSLTRQFRISELEDIVAITALARPGPMSSGSANEWVKRRLGTSAITYPHPLFEPYLKDTLGIVLYQEQVLTIGREIGGLGWEDVTALRKALSKSLGEEFFNKYGDKWKAGAVAKGIPMEVLTKAWTDLCKFGSWSFNRSHAVAYGLVSYWCCWLKAHHPVEFAAATLDAEKDPGRQLALLRELAGEGIDYLPVDPDHSTTRWEPVVKDNRKLLVGPLTNIKGIGPVKVKTILSHREDGKPLPSSLCKLLAEAKTEIDTLYPVREKIKSLDLPSFNIITPHTEIIDVQCDTHDYVVLIIAVINKIVPRDENEDINIAKRNGRKLNGGKPTPSLNMFFKDDIDEIFCKINWRDYHNLGQPIVERGRAGKALYAVKGRVPKDFRMISVTNIRYLGDMAMDVGAVTQGGKSKEFVDP